MWKIISYTLSPLTNITPSKVKIIWNKIEQDAFGEIRWIVDRGILLAYPYFNEEFKINTDAINL